MPNDKSVALAVLRVIRLAFIVGCIVGWFGIALFPEERPFWIVPLSTSSLYYLVRLAMIYREVRRVRKALSENQGFLDVVPDATTAFWLWLAGDSHTQIRFRAEKTIRKEQDLRRRKTALSDGARELKCEGEVHRLRIRQGLAAAEALLRQRRSEFDERQRRLNTALTIIESRGWNEVAKAAIESKDLDELEKIVRELGALTGQASRLGILDVVDGFLREGRVDDAQRAVRNEQIASDRSHVLRTFKTRIDALRPHTSCVDLEEQRQGLVELSFKATDRDFRKAVHALEMNVQRVELVKKQCKKT